VVGDEDGDEDGERETWIPHIFHICAALRGRMGKGKKGKGLREV
jgi:hypothetical protein